MPEANELLWDFRNETSAPRRSDTLVALLGIDDVETLKNVDGVGQLCLFGQRRGEVGLKMGDLVGKVQVQGISGRFFVFEHL